jgi:serine/threonine-protein kinase
VVFEMLTGRVPFPGEDPLTVLNGHLNAPVPRASSLRPDLPVWIDVTLGRALAKNPDERWSDIAEFGRALTAAEGDRVTVIAKAPVASGLLSTYELGDRLGPGRLGSEVYRGVHRAMGHPVAIRLLRRDGDRNWEGARARFLREAQTLQVAHPSIIQVRDYGEEPGLVYLVTDFIEGPSLRELMQRAGALPWPRLRRLAAQLVEAAHVLHRRKGLLCGVNPDIIRITTDEDGERLMISSAGVWQASDLLATLQERTLRGIGLADAELRYVAPELMTGRSADVRSDVFTMGVVLYEMSTGTLPFDGNSMPELLGAMLRGCPADPRTLQATLPQPAADALMRAVRPSPDERFESARAFGDALNSPFSRDALNSAS